MRFKKSFAWGGAVALALLVFAIARPAATEEGESADSSPDPAGPSTDAQAAPAVGLDALLRLPSGPVPSAQPGGANPDRERWESRFAAVRADLAEAQSGLATAQSQLESMAKDSESWQMAAPGAQHDPETSPISFKLRNEIRERREEIARAERRLRELEVEASLAGVPAEWRRPPVEDASPDS